MGGGETIKEPKEKKKEEKGERRGYKFFSQCFSVGSYQIYRGRDILHSPARLLYYSLYFIGFLIRIFIEGASWLAG